MMLFVYAQTRWCVRARWRSYHWLRQQHGGNARADAASARADDPLLCLGSIRALSYSSA